MVQCPYCKRKCFENTKSSKFILKIKRCVECINDERPYSIKEVKLYEENYEEDLFIKLSKER